MSTKREHLMQEHQRCTCPELDAEVDWSKVTVVDVDFEAMPPVNTPRCIWLVSPCAHCQQPLLHAIAFNNAPDLLTAAQEHFETSLQQIRHEHHLAAWPPIIWEGYRITIGWFHTRYRVADQMRSSHLPTPPQLH